jgi:small subunit ribosomal protein S16
MVAIRLSRVGKKGHASFRFVVSDKRKDMYGPALEILGWYDPHANPTAINVKGDRVQYWLSKGAQASATVHNLLITAGIIKGEKVEKAHAKKPKVDPAAAVKKDEPKAEAPKAEAKVEAPKEEVKAEAPKVEEKPIETPKVEEKPAEAPKVEEKPAEAPKAEEKKEDAPAA